MTLITEELKRIITDELRMIKEAREKALDGECGILLLRNVKTYHLISVEAHPEVPYGEAHEELVVEKKYLHEIRDFAVRGIEKLKVGMEIISCHASINSDTVWSTKPHFKKKTIVKIQNTEVLGQEDFRVFFGPRWVDANYATDMGVTEYVRQDQSTWWNDANFTVIAADLEAAGIEIREGIPAGHTIRKPASDYLWYGEMG